MCEVACVKFPLWEVTIFVPCALWREVPMCNPHLSSGKLRSTSLMIEYLWNIWNLPEKVCLKRSFSHLFTNSVFYLYQYRLMYIYFILLVILKDNLYFYSKFSSVAMGSSFTWLFGSFDIPQYKVFLKKISISSLYSTLQCSRLTLYVSCPRCRFSHLSREFWFLFLENGVMNQDMDSRCSHWYRDVFVSMPSHLKEQVNVYVSTKIHEHIPINMTVWIHLCWC